MQGSLVIIVADKAPMTLLIEFGVRVNVHVQKVIELVIA